MVVNRIVGDDGPEDGVDTAAASDDAESSGDAAMMLGLVGMLVVKG
jgi:hypothetical protein